MEIGTVRQIDIDQEMQGAYLDYAMSVIVARALPDVRDGLKPVHRRILYAMHDMGVRHDKAYKKSARIVGEVLGKYHPHSDDAVYEAMARMAQDFSLRYVLVDGQGNFGSIDGDSPAAMRYTEARMATIAEEMLADIDKETVDFVPNFDDTLTEPAVLPAVLPNLLLNGAAGIAVGMATNIPPHNLSEVCDALIHLIDNYQKIDDVTVEDLVRFIQGPDFPTGGVVYRFAGRDGDGDRVDLIRNAYALGRGRLTVQAQVHIEQMSRSRSRIVVTELPYQVNKTRLIERIAELVRDGKLEGITDLRDESDRQGMRLCIELTRTVDPREVLSQLFKLTPMQTTFSMRMLALVDGEPRLLPLKRVLVYYLEHRQKIITRRSRYLLERAKQRAHILEGLLKALDNIEEVISIIRRSRTTDMALENLMKQLDLTEIQAQAILDMPLRRLVALEQRKIVDEHKARLQEIRYLQGLLRSPAKIRGVIREDLLTLKQKYGDARRTHIVDQEKGHHTARDLVEAEDVLVTLWRDGQVTRTARVPRVSSKAIPVAQVWGDTRDDLAILTASGQAAMVPLHQVPADQNTSLSGLTDLDRAQVLVGAAVIPHPTEGEELPDAYLTLLTRGGRVKRIAMEELSAGSRGTATVMSVESGDEMAWVVQTSGQDELFLVTRQGKAIRFSENDVRPMGLLAAGVFAVKLGRDDGVVGMGVVRDDAFAVIMTENGYAKRTALKDFPTQKRYGGGVQAINLTSPSGRVAAMVVADERQDVALVTDKGRVTKLPIKAIHLRKRTLTGFKSPQDIQEPYLDSTKHEQVASFIVLAGTETDAGQAQAKAILSEKQASRSSKKSTVDRSRSTRDTREKEVEAKEDRNTASQMPLPLDSAATHPDPTELDPAKPGRETTTRKRKSVRSVPKT